MREKLRERRIDQGDVASCHRCTTAAQDPLGATDHILSTL